VFTSFFPGFLHNQDMARKANGERIPEISPDFLNEANDVCFVTQRKQLSVFLNQEAGFF